MDNFFDHSIDPWANMPPRLATIDNPVWMKVDGEWFLDNGEW
jgi:hypothetical protein